MDEDMKEMELNQRQAFKKRVDKCIQMIDQDKDEYFDMVYDPKTIVEVSKQVYERLMKQSKNNVQSLAATISRLSTFKHTEPQGIKQLKDVFAKMNNDMPLEDYGISYKDAMILRKNYVHEFLETTEVGLLHSFKKNNEKIAKKAIDFYVRSMKEKKVEIGVQVDGNKYVKKLEKSLHKAMKDLRITEKTLVQKIDAQRRKHNMKIENLEIQLENKVSLCTELSDQLNKTRTRLMASKHTLQSSVNDIKKLKSENKFMNELNKEKSKCYNIILEKVKKVGFFYGRICENLKKLFPLKSISELINENIKEVSNDEEGEEEDEERKQKCILSREGMIDLSTMMDFLNKNLNEIVEIGEDAIINNHLTEMERKRRKLKIFYLSDIENIKEEMKRYLINPGLDSNEISEIKNKFEKEEMDKERVKKWEERKKRKEEERRKAKEERNLYGDWGNSKKNLDTDKSSGEEGNSMSKSIEKRNKNKYGLDGLTSNDYSRKGKNSNPFEISDKYFLSDNDSKISIGMNKKTLDYLRKIIDKLEVKNDEKLMLTNLLKFLLLGQEAFKVPLAIDSSVGTVDRLNLTKTSRMNITGDNFHNSARNKFNLPVNNTGMITSSYRKKSGKKILSKTLGKFGTKDKSKLSTERDTFAEGSLGINLRDLILVGRKDIMTDDLRLNIHNADTVEKRIRLLLKDNLFGDALDRRLKQSKKQTQTEKSKGLSKLKKIIFLEKILNSNIWKNKNKGKKKSGQFDKDNKTPRGYNLLPANSKLKKKLDSKSKMRIKSQSHEKNSYRRKRKIVERKQKTWRKAEIKIPEKILLGMNTKFNPLDVTKSTVIMIDDIVQTFLDTVDPKLQKSASTPKFPIAKLPVFKQNQNSSRKNKFMVSGEILPAEFIERFRDIVEKEIKQFLLSHKRQCDEGTCPHLNRLYQRISIFFANLYKNRGKLFKMNKVNIDKIIEVEKAKGFRPHLFPKPGNMYLD